MKIGHVHRTTTRRQPGMSEPIAISMFHACVTRTPRWHVKRRVTLLTFAKVALTVTMNKTGMQEEALSASGRVSAGQARSETQR